MREREGKRERERKREIERVEDQTLKFIINIYNLVVTETFQSREIQK